MSFHEKAKATVAEIKSKITLAEMAGKMKVFSDKRASDSALKAVNPPKGEYVRCAHKHPPLKGVTPDGIQFEIYGGAASSPVYPQCEIFVALDGGSGHEAKEFYPWHGGKLFIPFYIQDMSVPKNPAEFKLMINWLAEQIRAGKKVHVGCMGGHGRTGLVLSALIAVLTGELDAITYVRKGYCEKAVESHSQVEFLKSHYGIKRVTGHKEYQYSSGDKSALKLKGYDSYSSTSTNYSKYGTLNDTSSGMIPIDPLEGAASIWWPYKSIDKTP